ncbi:MAG: DEAD/DEAH box helicase [Bacteroidaceae bacterium]|nr:DEAD/DEAH box helicase [Bacteroidaceae bacterium]
MTFDTFSSLSEDAQRLLGLYAFCYSGSYSATSNGNTKLSAYFDDYDHDKAVRELKEKGLFEDAGYSWYTNSRNFIIQKDNFLPAFLYLLEVRKDLVEAYNAMRLPKSNNFASLRNSIIELVESDYRESPSAAYIDMTGVKYLYSISFINATMPLFENLNKEVFASFLYGALNSLCDEDKIFSFNYFYKIINENKNLLKNQKQILISEVDLYRYLADGTFENTEVSENNYAGLTLFAIRSVNKGEYAAAVKFFSMALKIKNRSTDLKNVYLNSIINYYLILAYKHEGSVDSQNKMRVFANKKDVLYNPCLVPSKILVDSFLGINDAENKKTISRELTSSNNTGITLLFLYYLLAKYLGCKIDSSINLPYPKPNFGILRHELSEFLDLTDEERQQLKEAYGDKPALTTIHRLEDWELVVQKLTRTLGGETLVDEQEKSSRLMYLIHNWDFDNEIEVREQTRLKNGEWGGGRIVSNVRYMSGALDCMNEADKRIQQKCISTYGVSLYDIIEEMAHENRLYAGSYAPFEQVHVTEEKPYLVIDKKDDGFHITSNIKVDQIVDNIVIRRHSMTNFSFIKINPKQYQLYKPLLELGVFPLKSENTLKELLPRLGVEIEIHSGLIDGGSTLSSVDGDSKVCVQILPNKDGSYWTHICAKPIVTSGRTFSLGKGEKAFVDEYEGERVWVNRDMEGEKQNRKVIRAALIDIFRTMGDYARQFTDDLLDFVDEESCNLEPDMLLPLVEYIQEHQDFIYVEWPEGKKLKIKGAQGAGSWTANIKSRGSWFEIEGDVQIDENNVISMSALLDLINQSKGRYIKLGDGEYLALNESLNRQLRAINAISARDRGKIHISPFSAAMLGEENLHGEVIFNIDQNLRDLRKRIEECSTYAPEVPKDLNGTLRPYQKEGYQWISRLNSWGAGALLADDMGLGKTVQTISFFLLKKDDGPSLVVAPASVAPNWLSEFEKFAPSLNACFLNTSADRAQTIKDAKAGDVIVTTYGLLLSVKDEITEKSWNVACLDEAHIIKNRGAKTSGVAMKLCATNRIMLTGTPIQNHLGELWSLFQFVNPGLLGGYEDFQRRYIIPIERDEDMERQEMLDKVVHPFMLRRTKNAVLHDLPEKTEIYQKIELSDEELTIYEAIRNKAEKMLEERGNEAPDINVLAEITRLRQASCSASLVEKNWRGQCSKINALLELLSDVIEGDNRALIFSQFTSFLDIVRSALDKAGIKYLYLDGGTPVAQRIKLVQSFQDGECPIFVISLKAGGLGLNLTNANYVFHLDPWWNPAIEQQATDRAYRIGQKQAVTVYHLIAQNTIEEKIIRLHETKRNLAENILQGTESTFKLTGKDLLEMIKN